MNGWIAERNFRIEAKNKGYLVTKSTDQEDMFKHIDFFLEKDGKNISVDVKARKRATRASWDFDDEYTWVEFQNVRGHRGWLYGDANYIVFERKDDYIFIDRERLLKFSLDAVNDIYVDSPREAIYKKYQRYQRDDVVSRIKLDHALDSEYFKGKPPMIWKKSNDESSS